jgi:hypothetical protein
MNRELLEKPFDPAQIKQRQGRNGRLDYIEGHSVVHRLNGRWRARGRSRSRITKSARRRSWSSASSRPRASRRCSSG